MMVAKLSGAPLRAVLRAAALGAVVTAISLGGGATPAAGSLIPGGGSPRSDCIAEFSSTQFTTMNPRGRARRSLRCTDGARCDADGRIDGVCTLSLAICLNNADPDLPQCKSAGVHGVTVKQKRSRLDPELTALQDTLDALPLPATGNTCSQPIRVTIPVRQRANRARPGKKRLRITATTTEGARDKDSLKIACYPGMTPPPNQAPRVSATAAPVAGSAPLTVRFAATATDDDGTVVSTLWIFGDGATGTGLAVSHAYETEGTFTAQVQASDDDGATGFTQVKITVWPASDLSVRHANRYPTRLAEGPDGRIYVSDAKVGSVFIYDSSLKVVGEIKNLDQALGVAVGPRGNIYVGSRASRSVQVFSASGAQQFVIDDGNISMPNDIAIDRDGRVYVADSFGNTVRVYDSNGTWLRNVGQSGEEDGAMMFPAAVTIAYRSDAGGPEAGELYVADQDHCRVEVYDLEGRFRRAYGGPVPAFSSDWKGKFVKLQGLAVDRRGRLHALDSYLNKVQVLDARTGEYIESYGEFGAGAGQLNLPLDLIVTSSGQVAVTNAENHRVEIIHSGEQEPN